MRKKSVWFMAGALAAGLFWGASAAHAQGFTFTTIDAPNSIFTVARAVNSQGDIVGWFPDTGFKRHGYLLSNGNFTQIDFNNDVNRRTTALGLNHGGDIVGDYRGTDGRTHGYLLSGGTSTNIDPPSSVRTTARAINSSGDIVGFFRDSTGGFHGFLVNKSDLTSFTTLDFPGATFTLATAINDSGEIVGLHGDSAFVDHAFVRSPGGTITAVADVPGAVDTDSWAIDNTGRIAGFNDELGRAALSGLLPDDKEFFPVPVAVLHGYLRDGSSLTRVNISGVSGGINTCIFGINDSGVIVGQYDSPDGRTHGFVGIPKGN